MKWGHMPFSELIVYFDSEEESGGSNVERDLSIKLAKECDFVFLADTSRPNFGIVTKRKTNGTYTFTAKGVDGHAGNAPHAALGSPLPPHPWDYTTEALEKKGIKDTGQYIPYNVINVAVVTCDNDKSNVIPPLASLMVNLRCYEQAEHELFVAEMKKLAKTPSIPGCTVTFEGKQTAKPMELTPDAKKMVDLYTQIAKRE
jgi:acetylornithine deacetylase/succinyl-diaminopimelate desuccinylase-like protein